MSRVRSVKRLIKRREFQENGALFVFVEFKSKAVCLICIETVAMMKEYIIRNIMILSTARNTMHWKDIFKVTNLPS
jgi:hypothetical protein